MIAAALSSLLVLASGKLLPVDDATKDPSLVAFRARVLQALDKRDVGFVHAMLDPEILVGFGNDPQDDAIGRFDRAWTPAQATSKLWGLLRQTLILGGTFQGDTFCAPYVFRAFPRDQDASEYVAILRERVPVREAARKDAPTIDTLSYDIVRAEAHRHRPGWLGIVTASGRSGFVADSDARSPTDYRACFKKRGNDWKMTAFIAGD